MIPELTITKFLKQLWLPPKMQCKFGTEIILPSWKTKWNAKFGTELLPENTKCSVQIWYRNSFRKHPMQCKFGTEIHSLRRKYRYSSSNSVQRDTSPKHQCGANLSRDSSWEHRTPQNLQRDSSWEHHCSGNKVQKDMLPEIRAMEIGYRDLPQKEQASVWFWFERSSKTSPGFAAAERHRETQRSDAASPAVACCTVIAWTVCAWDAGECKRRNPRWVPLLQW